MFSLLSISISLDLRTLHNAFLLSSVLEEVHFEVTVGSSVAVSVLVVN